MWGEIGGSNGRASALHAEGTRIDTLLLHFFLMMRTKSSAQPESNQRPRDINCKQLQSPALPTELYADVVSSN